MDKLLSVKNDNASNLLHYIVLWDFEVFFDILVQ